MRKKMRIRQCVKVWLLVSCLILGVLPAGLTQAAVSDGTTTLRILATTDLHGQSVTINYDSASEHKTGSLAQAATLIKQMKSSLKYGNTLLLDVGDTIYGYGTDCISSGLINGPEYMYAALAALDYDALTVGNHDFDYGYTYLKEQLKETGLASKAVVSNVYDAKTKKNIWAENKVITKKLNTTAGKSVSVKIGLIGVTIPGLTGHYDHSLLLTTKDMVESVEEQVGKLKEQNVDLIVVMAHSGIGVEKDYVQMSDSAAYQISKIDGVDAIVGGHAHVNFPSADENVQKFYAYAGVSSDGKLNGVPYVASADHGAGVGVIDLKLKVAGGKVSVASSSAKVKKVKSSTALDETVTAVNDTYQQQINEIYSTSIAQLNGASSTYFAPIEDNMIVQLANEAKIHYGLEYVNQVKTEFKDTPVIAATSYGLVDRTKAPEISVDGEVTVGDSLKLQNKNKEFAFIYSVTGSDIREWLEWQASAYQNPEDVENETWTDEIIELYAKKEGVTPILNSEWMDDWSGFLVFDGIEYEFDTSQPARYNKAGNVINKKAYRVTSLTCNGQEVTDDMEFALVSQRLNQVFCKVATSRSEYVICNKRVYLNDIIQDYLKDQYGYAPLSATPDNNWRVHFSEDTAYIVKGVKASETAAKTKTWYENTLEKTSKYRYYQASLDSDKMVSDGSAPLLVVGLGKTKKTNQGVPVVVQASDRLGVQELKYAFGVFDADSDVWSDAASIDGNCFTVRENGIYSVMAADAEGNRTVKYVQIENYDAAVLEAPDITKCTNRSSKILGTAEPGTTVYAKADGITYSAEVAEDGSFGIATPKLAADSTVKVWIEDANGTKSEQTAVTVKRTGANEPQLDDLTNKSSVLSGWLNDSKYCKIIAIVDDTVYVPEDGGEQAYENCSIYDYEKTIKKVTYEVDEDTFRLYIPVPLAGASYQVYSLDWTDKNSVVTKLEAADVAPNQPKLTQLYEIDDYVYGKIPSAKKDTAYEIQVSDGTETYTGAADANGAFVIPVGELPEGTKLTVTASDTKDGEVRTSAEAQLTILPADALEIGVSDIRFAAIDSKTMTVSGTMKDYEGKLNLMIGKQRVSVEVSDEAFSYELTEPLAVGTSITALVRDTDGSILDANRTSVALAVPDVPVLLTKPIYDTATEISLFSKEEATAVVKVGNKYYKAYTGVYDADWNGYVYTVTLKKQPKVGDAVIVYMMNESGKSGKVKSVVEQDPEALVEETETETDIETQSGETPEDIAQQN